MMSLLHPLMLAAAVLHGADAVTTSAAIARGARESPGTLTHTLFGQTPSPVAVGMQQGAEAVGFAVLETQTPWAKRHPRWTLAIVAADLVAEGWAVRTNLQNLRALQRR